MTVENPIFAEIAALLESAPDAGIDELEDTLTSGYAAALQLEAERWRIERRIAEVAGIVESAGGTDELTRLARRLTAADHDLSRLRGLLGTLRDRADAVRTAA
jgi:post-segregation antitoxin (ccd killing protein)